MKGSVKAFAVSGIIYYSVSFPLSRHLGAEPFCVLELMKLVLIAPFISYGVATLQCLAPFGYSLEVPRMDFDC